jgi:ribosomal protein S18/ribosomal protein S6
MKNYEFYFIINPELNSDANTAVIKRVTDMIESDFGATNLAEKQDGLKKMAYEINKHQTGFYTSITFDMAEGQGEKVSGFEKKINLIEEIIRYILVNQTGYNKGLSKESRKEVEIKHHRELNKTPGAKKDISTYMGLRVINFKDYEYLNQFTSPYAKIFARTKTGSNAKFQRKITTAIKRARHMALMPFTPR